MDRIGGGHHWIGRWWPSMDRIGGGHQWIG